MRAALTVGAIQPGNNFRVVAGSHAEVADRVKALSFDAEARLYYDRNNDEIYDPFSGLEPVIAQVAGHRGMKATPELEVWRTLHLEVDSMGPVEGNTVQGTSGTVTPNADGTFTVPVSVGEELEPNRFENGGLQDSQGYLYPIVSNTESSLVVQQGNNPQPPMSNAAVWFWDDDQLRDGQDVPMPDSSALAPALAEAYVRALNDLPGRSDVPFVLNVENTDATLVAAQRWDSVALNADAYWMAYVLGAFQPARGGLIDPHAADGDPNTEIEDPDWVVTGQVPTNHQGGALIYLETIRDVAQFGGRAAPVEEAATVAHEVGHLFNSLEEPVLLYDDDPTKAIAYTETYLRVIRVVDKPASR